MTKKLLMGNEAFAHAALESGVRVIAGYPGTPSSEVVETVAQLHGTGAAQGVHVEWSTNEKAALEVLAGASYAGARGLFTCKQVGLNVASDALMSLNYVGVQGGLVLFVADDPGPISSQTEQDTRRFASFAKVPVFDPENIEQGFDMMQAAFDLSEKHRCPVIVRPTTRVCHSSTFIDVAEATQAREPEGFVKDDARWVIFPARAHRGHLEVNARLQEMAREFSRELARFNPVEEQGVAPRLGVMCGGVSSAYAREALALMAQRCQEAGIELPAYRFMQVGTPYPFPEEAVGSFAEGLEAVLVLEELDHVLEDELVRLMGKRAAAGKGVAQVVGRGSAFEACFGESRPQLTAGENSTERAFACLKAFFEAFCEFDGSAVQELSGQAVPANVPPRPPVLCAGCPHRGAFFAAKRALRKMGARGVFSGDIGCYTLGNAAPLDAVDTCLCMGAGITMAQGLGVAEPGVKQLAFVGDSTFFASGLTGIANAVYNQHDITICVLDNSITAMTGGQPHPGTGSTLMGAQAKPLVIEEALTALGVECIAFANPHCLDESVAAVQKAVAHPGPAAVVFRAPCVNLVKSRPAVLLDAASCTGCKKCITSIGCPAIGFSGGVAVVDTAQCTGCGLCVQVCPFGAIAEA